ncbi:MAG: class I SAM-dependent methyltransferase, partial [Bacteroidetes bacterium]|nr:class I SAM-dependent methyltransferase [Bacteroidota bacterium]
SSFLHHWNGYFSQDARVGSKKIAKKNLSKVISLTYGTAEHIPYPDSSFDAVTVGFGIRNFENLLQGLSEIYRVLRKNGVAAILEFSHPRHFPFKQFYKFYSTTIIPILGDWISGNSEAYTYLPNTIAAFPSCETISALLRSVGFTSVHCYPKTFGIVTIYIAEKKEL